MKASMDRIFLIGRDEVPQSVHLAAGESLKWTFLVLPGTQADVLTEICIDGEGCEVDIAGLYLCTRPGNVGFNVRVRHNAGNGISRQLFKGIVAEGAKAVFDGLIYVRRGSLKTKAYQENHTVLLSQDARVETSPQLEIYADDVECSHGATTGYLNPEELFYMRSRGIDGADARRLQIISFLAPVAARLPDELKSAVYESLSEC